MSEISFNDFLKIDLRVGTIIKAEAFPEARKPAYILHVDFGETIGIKKSSAQITAHYQVQELIGKQIIAVVNFPEKQIGPIRSEILITGFADENGAIILATVDKPTPNGSKLH